MIFFFIMIGIFFGDDEPKKTPIQIKEERKALKLNQLSATLAFSGDIEKINQREFVVIFDDSGSMSGDRLKDAKKALRFFLNSLRSTDKITMIALNSGIFKGKEEILANYQIIKANGGTPLGRALKNAKKYLDKIIKQNSGYGEFIIVSISDGDATDVTNYELNDILKSIYHTKEADIILNTIGFHLDSSNSLNSPYSNFISASNGEELQKAFNKIVAENENFDVTSFK